EIPFAKYWYRSSRMKIRVLWIGRTKDELLSGLIRDYTARIKRFLPVELVEVKEPRVDESRRVDAEGEKMLAAVNTSDRTIILDPSGKNWTSQQFAQFVAKHMRDDPRHLTFIIGGFSGLSDEVKKRADVVWSLSPMTFTHDLCRVLM